MTNRFPRIEKQSHIDSWVKQVRTKTISAMMPTPYYQIRLGLDGQKMKGSDLAKQREFERMMEFALETVIQSSTSSDSANELQTRTSIVTETATQ